MACARVGPLTRWLALRNGATHYNNNNDGVMGKDGTMGNEGATGDGATTTTWQWRRNVDNNGNRRIWIFDACLARLAPREP